MSADELHSRSVTLSPGKRLLLVGQTTVRLSPKAFDLLHVLMRANGNVLSRKQLLAEVWGTSADVDTKTVEFHIRQIRQALKPFGLEKAVATVPRRGYAWRLHE